MGQQAVSSQEGKPGSGGKPGHPYSSSILDPDLDPDRRLIARAAPFLRLRCVTSTREYVRLARILLGADRLLPVCLFRCAHARWPSHIPPRVSTGARVKK